MLLEETPHSAVTKGCPQDKAYACAGPLLYKGVSQDGRFLAVVTCGAVWGHPFRADPADLVTVRWGNKF